MPQPAPADSPPSSSDRTRRIPILIALAVGAVLLGIGAGVLVGHRAAARSIDHADVLGGRASVAEDDARDRRDLLDARIELMDTQTASLPEVATDPPLLASAKTTTNRSFGTKFSVDGGTYTVNGIDVVDSFDSIEPSRPAKQTKGFRWVLVDVDYRNDTKEEQAPACGTLGTVHIVLDDGTTVRDVRDHPPVHEGTYARCGTNIQPGHGGRWWAPSLVPEGSKIAGVLVEDVYARTSDSEYNVQSGTAGWLAFDKPIDVGSIGDDKVHRTFGTSKEGTA